VPKRGARQNNESRATGIVQKLNAELQKKRYLMADGHVSAIFSVKSDRQDLKI
jgi:hypothetical protein